MPTSKDFTYTRALFNLFRNVRITVIFVDEKLHADGRGVNTLVAVAFARWNFLLFLSLKTIKNSTGQMRQLKRVCCHWVPPMIGWRRDKHTNLHMARGFSVLYHVFARKQCILCSSLRHKSYLTLPYVTSLPDSFSLGTFALGFTRLPPGSLASSRGCLLTITYH